MARTDPLVSAAWLLDSIGSPYVRVLDATWVPPFLKDRPNGKALYAAQHIPNAPYFDIDDVADNDTSLKHMLPNPTVFGQKVGALGIHNDAHVVVYDSNGFFASARVWWMFRAMGHDAVSVLDGGLTAWVEAGGSVTSEFSPLIPATFHATQKPDLVRDMNAMREHIARSDISILDARAQGRFDGTAPEPRPELPSGHMPGSSCVPVTSLIDEDGTLKSEAALAPMLTDYIAEPVVTSCGSGVSAAVISLALARLGNWKAAVYDGSWSEWAAHSDNLIATTS